MYHNKTQLALQQYPLLPRSSPYPPSNLVPNHVLLPPFYLYSQRLYAVLDGTLAAFQAMQQGAAKNLSTPQEAMLPRKVRVMMELRNEIAKRYL